MKAYTDLEQSKKLAEFLPLESADMIWVLANPDLPMIRAIAYEDSEKSKYYEILPAWSLAALKELITKIQQGGIFYNLTYDFILNKWTMNIEADNWTEDVGLYDNPIDACYEMIIKLHELNLL